VEIFVGCRLKWSSENFAVAFGLVQWHVFIWVENYLLRPTYFIYVFYPTGCAGHGSVNGDHRYTAGRDRHLHNVSDGRLLPGIHFERVSVGRLLVTRWASDMIGCATRAGRSVPTSSYICSPTAASRGELDYFGVVGNGWPRFDPVWPNDRWTWRSRYEGQISNERFDPSALREDIPSLLVADFYARWTALS